MYAIGDRPQIYSAQEVHTVGDVGHSIPRIYVVVDNRQANSQELIIEMDGKLCDQVVSILIDPGSKYSYSNPDLMYKCGFRKENLVGTVGYRYEEVSSTLGKSLCISVKWHAYNNTFECISIGIYRMLLRMDCYTFT